MGLLQLQGARAHPTYAEMGSAQVWPFPTVSLTGNVTTPASQAQMPLPCNCKILAISAIASGAGGSGIGINVASGPSVGSFATGTITFTGTAGSTGTCTITIAGPTGFSQVIGPFAITNANTATQSAVAAVNAINAATSPQIYATNSAGVVTIYQLTSPDVLAVVGAQTYQAVLANVSTQTVGPTTATAFTGSPTAALGTPDNTKLGVVPPTTAASGQLWLPSFGQVPVSTNGTNTVIYPPQIAGVGACWDIIFPVTRTLSLIGIFTGYDGTDAVSLQVRVLAVPVILDPTHPHDVQWTPNNKTIGAPSTD